MSVLVDTGVLYADHDTDATRHEAAAGALERVYDGEFGQPYVTDYVFDEAVTLALRRSGSFEAALQLGQRLRGVDPYPEVYELLYVSMPTFEAAVDVFKQHPDQGLSFTDATLITQYERQDVDGILTFDNDFDGLVDRLSPVDL